jgi:hypothetical protein
VETPKPPSDAVAAGQAIGQARSLANRALELVAESSRLMGRVRPAEVYCLWTYLKIDLSGASSELANLANRLGRVEDSVKEVVALIGNEGRR